MTLFIFKNHSKTRARLPLILAALLSLFSYPSLAQETPSLCMSTCWVPVPPVQGKCSEGEILPPACQHPSEKISECSCLRPVDILVPCLPLSIPSVSYVVMSVY